MINWKDHGKEYNPIRSHINLGFQTVNDEKAMVETIVDDLESKKFDFTKSRVLIFVRTRNQAEEITVNLNKSIEDRQLAFQDKVDFYHAGLDGTSRTEKYESYKNGEIVILIATKAFGMGMDIKNIHFIYHSGPSSTFEDYLQEVGRAGRNQASLEKAGYSEANPIQARCLMTFNDFNTIKDLQHKNQITWARIEQVRNSIFDYVSKFRNIGVEKENAFSLPLDLLNQIKEYDEFQNKDTLFRIILYWLEKLKRIRLGVYTPSQLPIKILSEDLKRIKISFKKEEGKLHELLKLLLKEQKEKFSDAESVMVGMQHLKDALKLKSTTNLFKLLFLAQKSKLIILERSVSLEITKNRSSELNRWGQVVKSPRIEATFDFAEKIIKSTVLGSQVALDNQELEEYILNVVNDNFRIENVFWIEETNKGYLIEPNKISKKLINDFKDVRAKFAFKIINYLPNIKHKSYIEYEGETTFVSQLIYNGNASKVNSIENLRIFKYDLINLIKYVSEKYLRAGQQKFNIVDLIITLNIEEKGEKYFQKLVFIAKGLGYLKGMGGVIVPMGVELFIRDISALDLKNELDLECSIEFDESNKMKSLRLLALKCLSGLDNNAHDSFIKSYFQCSSVKSLITLLSEHLDDNHPDLRAYREEALKDRKETLNDSQRIVYDSNLDENLQVIAGPGTGKTHTLTLRIAKLIQEDKISPENILVLAYNRAVVIELKDRLDTLFRDLGYAKLISRLKVFTFHGLVKSTLGSELDNLEFNEWIPKFLDITRTSPGVIYQNLGQPKFVFVDEFQDITKERMDLLKFIANPDSAKICVIGDPNQSIYGYERLNAGGPMSPKKYYEDFANIYHPKVLKLNINYRSYEDILIESERLLSLNDTRFEMPNLLANNKLVSIKPTVEIIDYRINTTDWKIKLKELLDFSDENQGYRQVAIMFRSNNEVYRAFNTLKELNMNVRLRVQGSKIALVKTREFYGMFHLLKLNKNEKLPVNYLNDISIFKSKVLHKYSNWDEYTLDLFHCLAIEFQKTRNEYSTYLDLLQFIEEISSKDDGQFGKIYEQNVKEIGGDNTLREIVITTMHKVKGLEFDAVLIPPSFSNLPTSINFDATRLGDFMEEERRLYYVAYTRAKKRLVVIKHDREEALEQGFPHKVSTRVLNQLGLPVQEGIDKFTLYWSASNFGNGCFNFIKKNISIGDALVLKPIINEFGTFWYAFKNDTKIAALSRSFSNRINHLPEVNGFIVSSVYTHTYEETLFSDQKNDTDYAQKWNQESKDRGFVYVIDFSGYGK
jgi:ATP-dependent DNA helicase RecQ